MSIRLISGRSYTNDVSDLGFKVIKVQYIGTEYVKVKGYLFIKGSGMLVERIKNYKFYFSRINGWYQVSSDL